MQFFTQHLVSVNENYSQHFKHALRFSVTLLLASLVCLIHAILPFLFEKTGSKLIKKLHNDMVKNRHNLTPGNKVNRSLASTGQ
ncbi:DUF6356 family protein [Candidatus Sororendozoicomonas aggregata]|uniref:DUF6356 family protein n=1 Tax=Candidatus Sororendozoicomonas aggregata TaxID=3073239 RepID=UPI003B75CF91